MHPRKKPPSYELTGDSTMQFVREQIAKQKSKKPTKECILKDKAGAKVQTMETGANKQTKRCYGKEEAVK